MCHLMFLFLPKFTGVELDCADISDQIASHCDVIPRLADRLHKQNLITRDTCQAVKNDHISPPYAKASRMIRPAIERAEHDPAKHKSLVITLKEFNIRLK